MFCFIRVHAGTRVQEGQVETHSVLRDSPRQNVVHE